MSDSGKIFKNRRRCKCRTLAQCIVRCGDSATDENNSLLVPTTDNRDIQSDIDHNKWAEDVIRHLQRPPEGPVGEIVKLSRLPGVPNF